MPKYNLFFAEFPQGMGPATNGSGETGMGAKAAPPAGLPGQILCSLNAFGAKSKFFLEKPRAPLYCQKLS